MLAKDVIRAGEGPESAKNARGSILAKNVRHETGIRLWIDRQHQTSMKSQRNRAILCLDLRFNTAPANQSWCKASCDALCGATETDYRRKKDLFDTILEGKETYLLTSIVMRYVPLIFVSRVQIHFGKSFCDTFKAGQTVVIHGLTRDMQYNGLRGRIVPRFGEDCSTHLQPGEDGKWTVEFENTFLGRKEFKTENVMKVGKSAAIGALASASEASSAPTFSPRTHGTRSSSLIPEFDYGTWGFDGTGATPSTTVDGTGAISPAQDSPRSATQPAKPLIARRGSI